MNRSFRAQDSQMQMQAAVVKQRQQLRATMMKEKEEELALFLEMKKREKEQNNLLLFNNTEDFEAPFASRHGNSPIFNISSSTPARKTGADDFLNSENDKHDYDWLLSPPGTPLFPSLEMESQRTIMSQNASPQPEPIERGSLVSKQSASSPGLNSSGAAMRRPSSSGGPGSRPSTPTGRPMVTTGSKPSRSSTPTSRATLSSSKPTVSAAKPTVSAARSTTSTMKSTVPARSSTPSRSTTRSSTPTRSTTQSSTPTARPSIPPSKLTSRAATPTRRPSTPSSSPSLSAPPVKSSSLVAKSAPTVTKSAPTVARNPIPSRGSSPTVKSRPWKPSEMPGFSLDAPPNLRTSVPERPLSATRGRPGAPSSRSSSVEPIPNGRPRRQSCSPSRGRGPNGILHPSGSSVPAFSRGHSKINDNVSPVVIGTKMVDRVINMRKLAPPKQDDRHSPRILTVKSSSPDSSGFGRTLSKKSLDMAIRHMDIRRIMPGNLRPSMTNIPASSMYSVRSGPPRSRTISVSDSPLATSSNASSEVSVNNNGLCLDGIELEDDIGSERGGRSPLRGR
ncbi:mucin-5AC [Salix suchowensis]|nr:mucin-5AC [Salix suchowensis]